METTLFEGVLRYDFWSIVLMDGVNDPKQYAIASESRRKTRQTVGLGRGIASIATPQQWSPGAAVSVYLRQTFSPEVSGWNHVVEFDFDCETGTLAFGELDGPETLPFAVPVGRYRTRWSGRGFDEADAGADDGDDVSPDSYRLELILRSEPGPIVDLHRWHGFDRYG